MLDLANREARRAAPRRRRMLVRNPAPLVLIDEADDLVLDGADDDVEVHRSVVAGPLAAGDSVDVREDDYGFLVTGVIE